MRSCILLSLLQNYTYSPSLTRAQTQQFSISENSHRSKQNSSCKHLRSSSTPLKLSHFRLNQTQFATMAKNFTDPIVDSPSFSDFPEDVQLCVLSFLSPPEISAFACTSKRFVSLCRDDAKLWFSVCHRRWGTKTQISKWGSGKVSYKSLYRALHDYDNLIGFWRRSGHGKNANAAVTSPPLVLFEWGPSFVTGSRVSPSDSGTDRVVKAPFLWLSVMPDGNPLTLLDPDCRFELPEDVELSSLENELVPINVSFMGQNHVVIEENLSFTYPNSSPEGKRIGFGGDEYGGIEDVIGIETGSPGSLPDRLMSEVYQYFANRTSPGGDRASRRQRRREKERQGMKKWEPEHFVKIVNCSPTPSRPLQGLWKGIGDDMNLDFYLVAYDDIGGIACRRVGDASKPFSGYSPVFWTPTTSFTESPFSPEELNLYESRAHLRPVAESDSIWGQQPWRDTEVVSRILGINSSYDLVIPELAGGSSANHRHVEGRIWQYEDGSFGFGFLRNNFITDLKPIARDGCVVDTGESCGTSD